MLPHRDGIGQVMRGAWFPANVMIGVQPLELNIGYTSDHRILFLMALGVL